MQISHIAAFAFAATLCGTAIFPTHAPAADGFTRITTEAEFRQHVAGKKLMLGDNWVTGQKNGSLKGNFGGEKLKGAWAWRDGYFCRTLTTHAKDTDCQKWEIRGKESRVTRDRGKGKMFIYTSK